MPKRSAIASYKRPAKRQRTTQSSAVSAPNVSVRRPMYVRVPPQLSVLEKKFLDTDIHTNTGSQPWTSVGLALTLNSSATSLRSLPALITQGTGDSERIGRSIWIHSIQFRGVIRMAAGTSSADYNFGKIYMVLDRQCNGADATFGAVVTPAQPTGFRLLNNSRRFQVLKEKFVNFDALAISGNGTTIDTGQRTREWSFYHRFRQPLRIDYDASSGAVTDLTQANIFFMAVAKQNAPVMDMDIANTIRVRFTDGPGRYEAGLFLLVLAIYACCSDSYATPVGARQGRRPLPGHINRPFYPHVASRTRDDALDFGSTARLNWYSLYGAAGAAATAGAAAAYSTYAHVRAYRDRPHLLPFHM